MTKQQYWQEIIKLTDERIETLLAKRENGIYRQSSKVWIEGLIETNIKWRAMATVELEIIKAEQTRKEMSNLKAQTFRANDD